MGSIALGLEGCVIEAESGARPGFHLEVRGRRVYCLDLRGEGAAPRVGQTVRVTGIWSTAIKGYFEVRELLPLRASGVPDPRSWSYLASGDVRVSLLRDR